MRLVDIHTSIPLWAAFTVMLGILLGKIIGNFVSNFVNFVVNFVNNFVNTLDRDPQKPLYNHLMPYKLYF